jgi:hypothetical protein
VFHHASKLQEFKKKSMTGRQKHMTLMYEMLSSSGMPKMKTKASMENLIIYRRGPTKLGHTEVRIPLCWNKLMDSHCQ